MKYAATASASIVTLLALTSCGGDTAPAEEAAPTERVESSPAAPEDPFENIPEDAPINEAEDEEDIFRMMFDCEDSETVEECEQAYADGVDADMLDYDIGTCVELVEQLERDGGDPLMDCTSVTVPNSEFYVIFEEEMGYSVPGVLQAEDAAEEPAEPDESDVSFDSCEDADMHWGGLMNDDLDGLEVDPDELAQTEAWLQDNGCW